MFGRRKVNVGPFVRAGRDGTAACMICERTFSTPEEAREHVDALDRMGALADHIRIHSTDIQAMWRLRGTP